MTTKLEHRCSGICGGISGINGSFNVDREVGFADNGNMVKTSKWTNEEMWCQAVVLRKGGLTYSEIHARLSLSESRIRFGLEDVPSEDTIRRNLNRYLKSEKELPRTDLSNWIEGHRKDAIEAIDSYISKLNDDVRRAESLPHSYEYTEYGAHKRWILDQMRKADDELAKMEERIGMAIEEKDFDRAREFLEEIRVVLQSYVRM